MQPKPLLENHDPTHFFEHVCSVVLRVHADISKKVGGRVAFRVLGAGGGDWLIDLDEAKVDKGLSDRFDVLLELGREELSGLFTGKLDVESAIDDGRVRYNGDVGALVRLGAILEMAEG